MPVFAFNGPDLDPDRKDDILRGDDGMAFWDSHWPAKFEPNIAFSSY